MTNEEQIEEILIAAHKRGFGKEVIEKADFLMKNGSERFKAFSDAFVEFNKIHKEKKK